MDHLATTPTGRRPRPRPSSLRRASRRLRRERGAVAVTTALLLVPLLLVSALVVDIGNARDHRRQWQNAADAAALAAVTALYPAHSCQNGSTPPCFTDATSAAMSYAGRNSSVTTSDWSACAAGSQGALPSLGYVPTGTSSCVSYDSSSGPTKVRVSMPRTSSPAFFGGITGTSFFSVDASADAQVGAAVGCALCFLGSVDAGNGDFTVSAPSGQPGGSIAVDGNITAGPNSAWTSTLNQVAGTATGGMFTPAVTTVPSFSDPLASLVIPPSLTGLKSKNNPCTDGPGIYNGPVTLSPSGSATTCTLQPGLYVVANTWTLSNNTLLAGTGVTLYVRSTKGFLDLKNGYVQLSAPTAAGSAFPGMAIVYDRDNTNSLTLQGNGQTEITGGIYLASGTLAFNGNSCFGIAGGPVVALSLDKANGNQSCVNIIDAPDQAFTHRAPFLSR